MIGAAQAGHPQEGGRLRRLGRPEPLGSGKHLSGRGRRQPWGADPDSYALTATLAATLAMRAQGKSSERNQLWADSSREELSFRLGVACFDDGSSRPPVRGAGGKGDVGAGGSGSYAGEPEDHSSRDPRGA